MAALLHLDASASGGASRTRALTAALAQAFRDAAPGNTVVHRDLHADPLPHLPHPALHWAEALRTGEPPQEAAALQRRLTDELLAADALVIGCPLYNYSMPSALKAWIDHVHVPGTTAPPAPGPPLAGKAAVVVAVRGGDYGPGAANEGRDLATPVLELVLGEEMGMAVTAVAVNLTLAGPERPAHAHRSEREYRLALQTLHDLGSRLGQE